MRIPQARRQRSRFRNPLPALLRSWRDGGAATSHVERIATTFLRWLVPARRGAARGSLLRTLLDAYTPLPAAPKALSFQLRSVRKLWSSTLSIGIRLKW